MEVTSFGMNPPQPCFIGFSVTWAPAISMSPLFLLLSAMHVLGSSALT